MSRRTRQRLSLAALSLLAAAPPLLADNTAYYFVGPDNSLYSDPANWSSSATGPGGTPPGNGDLAFVTPSAPLTVTLDATPNGISLRQATFQGPSAGGPLVVNSSAPSFVEDVVSIGPNVSFNQTAGVIRGIRGTSLTGPNTSYSLSGSSTVLYGFGFDIAGGVSFTQSGGQVYSVNGIRVGGRHPGDAGADSPTSYALSDGSFGGDSLTFDGPAPVSFTQTGGSVSSYYFTVVGRNASYSLAAGTLSTSKDALFIGSHFSLTGTYAADAGSTFAQSGGTLSLAQDLTPGSSGLVVNANPSGAPALYTMSAGSILLPRNTGISIGSTTSGTFIQTGGSIGSDPASAPSLVTLGAAAGSSGTYSLSGTGTLLTQALVVGDAGAGTFVQSDGSASAVNLTLAAQPGSSASYTLSGGSLRIAPFTYGAPFSLTVADQGIATFTQTGGSLSTGRFYLAKSAGSSATYNLSGGTLDASPVIGSAGTAYLRQTGGTLTAADLTIADQPGSTSSIYDLLAGSLTAPSVTNNGTFYMQPPASFAGRSFTNNRSATLDGTQAWPAGSTFTNTLVAYVHSDPAGPSGTPDSATLNFASASPDWAPVVFDAPATHLASLALSAATHATLPASPGAPRLLSTRALSITDTAQLDLADNTLLLAYGDTPSPLDTLRQYLLNARLTSSAADPTHRLGYLDTGSAVTVSLALTGDANLDGILNADDYALLDRSFARSLNNAHWTDGDFNYDGAVDASDYLLIDTTLGQAQGFSPGFLSTRESQFGAPYVSALLAAVPEPSLLLPSILYLLPASLLPRRRRRRRTLKIRRTFQ